VRGGIDSPVDSEVQ